MHLKETSSLIEQNLLIPITEQQVMDLYDKEANGSYGLVMIDHLNIWQGVGLPIGPTIIKKKWCKKITITVTYKCHAFASIDWNNPEEISYAIMLLGVNIGMSLPDSFGDQFNANHAWDDTGLPPNPENGHAMMAGGFTKDGIPFWSWGRWQFATWPYVRKYTDECYAIVDDKDSVSSTIDPDPLEALLAEIKKR